LSVPGDAFSATSSVPVSPMNSGVPVSPTNTMNSAYSAAGGSAYPSLSEPTTTGYATGPSMPILTSPFETFIIGTHPNYQMDWLRGWLPGIMLRLNENKAVPASEVDGVISEIEDFQENIKWWSSQLRLEYVAREDPAAAYVEPGGDGAGVVLPGDGGAGPGGVGAPVEKVVSADGAPAVVVGLSPVAIMRNTERNLRKLMVLVSLANWYADISHPPGLLPWMSEEQLFGKKKKGFGCCGGG
jgi:hypothetical protein